MAHGLSCTKSEGKSIGSRRIFAPHFKLQVLDSYRNDADCKGNQRATARKYGIHRRQIQKWLQVENTLRHSVIGAKEKIAKEQRESELTLSGRQQDDKVAARVPALTSCLPLDFSTRRPASPIDLSVKRPASASGAPVPCYAPPTPPLYSPQPDVWDLSTKNNNFASNLKRKGSCPISPKPVKLFKPYLDDLKDDEGPQTFAKLDMVPPCCPATRTPSCDGCCYGYDNNNVGEGIDGVKTVWGIVNAESDAKSDYGSCSYTLHELQQPESPPVNFYYYHPPPYAPAPDYECAGVCCYEECGPAPAAPSRHRQSYSLDFKLRAIDSYYQDAVCKGNQRAVASKYNVHRRQVQKWLKQAEELRSRSDTVKQIHAVS